MISMMEFGAISALFALGVVGGVAKIPSVSNWPDRRLVEEDRWLLVVCRVEFARAQPCSQLRQRQLCGPARKLLLLINILANVLMLSERREPQRAA